jgi:hypothetical protein
MEMSKVVLGDKEIDELTAELEHASIRQLGDLWSRSQAVMAIVSANTQ